MGAQAPGLAGTRLSRTAVNRRPYFMPWGDDGKGSIVLVPADRTHNTQLIDEDGVSEPYYQSKVKGFIPLNLLPTDHKGHKLFAAMCQRAVGRANSERLPVPDWVPPSMRGDN